MLSRIVLFGCALFSLIGLANAAEGFSIKDTAGQHLDILYGDKIVGRYMYAFDKTKISETYKPYLHIFDADGKAPITKGTGGVFPHHRAIFVGWNKMTVGEKTYDRWHMPDGYQTHQKFLEQKADADSATITSLVHYNAKGDGDPFLAEERTMTFRKPPAPAYVEIDVTSKLKPVGEAVTLGGDPEHAGMQFRPANEVDTKQTTYLYPKEKADPHKDRDYPWVGETFHLGDKDFSVVDLNSPKNPKETLFSAYRDYGRFCGFFKATIAKGEELTIGCRFIVIEGKLPEADWIEKQYNEFNGTSDSTPATTSKLSEQPGAPKPKVEKLIDGLGQDFSENSKASATTLTKPKEPAKTAAPAGDKPK